MNGGVLRPL